MDAIERAIRAALAKGDADDRGFRVKVYRSVFAALERSIAAAPELSAEAAQRRRDALKARIVEIEREFIPAIEPAASGDLEPGGLSADDPGPQAMPPADPPGSEPHADMAPAVDPADMRSGAGWDMPRGDGRGPGASAPRFDDASSPEAHLALGDGVPPIDEPVVDARGARERRPRRPGLVMAVATLAATIAILAWIGVELGLIGAPGPTGTTSPPPQDVQAQAETPAQGPGQADASRDWITVFSPADPTTLLAAGSAQVAIQDEEGTKFARLRSGAGGDAVLFDVGRGILERMAGRHAVFALSARAEGNGETQISISCNFGELGDCGRRRYRVGPGMSDYLFDVDLPAARPGSAGSIAIVADLDNGGRAVDVYEIKVSLTD